MNGQTIESTDLFNSDWQKRAEEIKDDDLLQINTMGRLLVALSLARADYFTKVLSKTTENTVMVMFSSMKTQTTVMKGLRDMLLRGVKPSDRDLQRVPVRAIPAEMRGMVLKNSKGITELQRRLEDVHKQYEINYIIFVMLAAEDSKDKGTYFIGSLLTKADLTLEIKRTLVCTSCGAQGTEKSSLKHCGKCKVTLYCSKECQTKDWPQHRAHCQA